MQQNPQQALEVLERDSRSLFEHAARLEVTDAESQRNGENILADLKLAKKNATAALKTVTDPIRAAEKAARELFTPYLAKVDFALTKTDSALQDYFKAQAEQAKQEQDYINAENAAKLEDAKESGEVVELSTATAQAPAKTSRADFATTSYGQGFDIVIINADLVPRDLCDPTMSKIRKRIESGVRVIPGVQIKPRVNIRTTRRE